MRRERKNDTHSTVFIFPHVIPGGVGKPGKGVSCYRLPRVSLVRGNFTHCREDKTVADKHELVVASFLDWGWPPIIELQSRRLLLNDFIICLLIDFINC